MENKIDLTKLYKDIQNTAKQNNFLFLCWFIIYLYFVFFGLFFWKKRGFFAFYFLLNINRYLYILNNLLKNVKC